MAKKSSNSKRLVLIDGHAIIHRAYHALPPLTSPGGQQTNAVYGFVSMLFRVIAELKPDFLAVAFDLPVPTFRHEAYIAYQAHRPHMEQEMENQIELVHEVVEAAGIPIYTAPGFEADDVIGTLARQAVQSKRVKEWKSISAKKTSTLPLSRSYTLADEVVIVTGDRDMLQLVRPACAGRDGVRVYAPIKGLSEARIFDRDAVKKYIGLTPEQIVDYKALIGDQSDNYPGVPGIGPKTAVELLKKYKSLDGIFKALGTSPPAGGWALEKFSSNIKVSSKIKEKLERGYDSAMLSQKLARISTDAPVKIDLEQARFQDLAKNEKFIQKLRELGFRSLVKRLIGEEGEEEKRKEKKKDGQMGLI